MAAPFMGFRPAEGQAGGGTRPAAVGSANAVRSLDLAVALIGRGTDPLEAVVDGIAIVEEDPNDMSVGYGGLPNEDGVVQLDSSVMHGPTHKAGAVAALENIKNPAAVALEVMRRTDHVLLVGEGALRFARRLGFREENLLTDKARAAWLRWKSHLSSGDDWLDPDQQVKTRRPQPAGSGGGGGGGGGGAPPIPYTEGTIHVSAVDGRGDLGACTSTSGLSWKIPGRVGDSPIVGAGMFVDNEVGSAGATGRGESCIQSCAAFQVVRHMANGIEPTEACLRVLRWIADHTKRPALLNARSEPNFDVKLYALRKDGAYGAAGMRGKPRFAVHDGTQARREACPALFE
jgi:N4-(beta-N-acetylglucosaminyl)-L-asparaginase